MKSRESLLRLRRFDVEEQGRKVSDLESMIAEFRRMAGDLDHQIAAEEQRAGVADPSHFSYPPFAKAAIQRRDNLINSVADLEVQLATARGRLNEAVDELKKVESLGERRSEAEQGGRSPAGGLRTSFPVRPPTRGV